MTEMYGIYSDEDLNEWERMPQNIRVLTSSAFGAWLLRRDKNIKKQEPSEDCISRQAALRPYDGLKDDDVIAVWLIRKNIEQQKTVNPQEPICEERKESVLIMQDEVMIDIDNPKDDCINRTELLKAIDTWDKFGFEHTGCFVREPKDDFVTYVHYDDVIKCIKGMPPVQPKPKTGDWETEKKGTFGIFYRCSRCHELYHAKTNYCPNCGIKMEMGVSE